MENSLFKSLRKYRNSSVVKILVIKAFNALITSAYFSINFEMFHVPMQKSFANTEH